MAYLGLGRKARDRGMAGASFPIRKDLHSKQSYKQAFYSLQSDSSCCDCKTQASHPLPPPGLHLNISLPNPPFFVLSVLDSKNLTKKNHLQNLDFTCESTTKFLITQIPYPENICSLFTFVLCCIISPLSSASPKNIRIRLAKTPGSLLTPLVRWRGSEK